MLSYSFKITCLVSFLCFFAQAETDAPLTGERDFFQSGKRSVEEKFIDGKVQQLLDEGYPHRPFYRSYAIENYAPELTPTFPQHAPSYFSTSGE